MSEIATCCSSGCDKIKALADQAAVVAAFDKLDECQAQVNYMDPDTERLEEAFEKLKQAVICLRETQ